MALANHKYILLALLLFVTSIGYAKKYYVYTDKYGNTVMSDKKPTKSTTGYKVINNQGSVIEKMDAALTNDEQKKQQAIQEARQRQLRLKHEQEEHDAVLLQTYTSTEDIIMARDNKIKAIDIRIEIIKGTIIRLQDQMTRLTREAAELERAGKPNTEFYNQSIQNTRRQIENNNDYIKQQENEKEAILITSNADVNRFRELIGEEVDTNEFRSKRVEDSFLCKDLGECNKVWTLSQIFVTNHATSNIQLVTSNTIATGTPKSDQDLGIEVRRSPKSDGKSEIVIELLCHQSETGRKYCLQDTVQDIKAQFYKMLRQEVFSRP